VHGASSLIIRQEPGRTTARAVASYGLMEEKIYSKALGIEKNLTRFKLTVKSKKTNRRKQSRDY